jgi:hypothetical protein
MKAMSNAINLERSRRSFFSASFGSSLLLVISTCCCFTLALWAQSSDSQANTNQSWTDTSESQSGNTSPIRTVESHTQSGNRTVDSQSIQRLGSDGNYEPYQDIEKTTVKVDSTTTRTITREYGRDADGARTLMQETQEEMHTRPGGDLYVVRSTSNPDANGNLQVVQREIAETKKIGKDAEETKTTVMLPSIDGGLAPAMMTQERRTNGANDTVDSKKTTLLPDGNGNWQVSEVKESKTQKDGDGRRTDTRVSRPNADGELSEISRTVSMESESGGNKRNRVDSYSLDVPGVPQDGNLHVVERTTIIQSTSATGQQNTQRQVERPDPGDPRAGLQVYIVSSGTVRTGITGTQATQTIRMRDANGNLGVVSVDTSKSDNTQAVQVQIAPAAKAK